MKNRYLTAIIGIKANPSTGNAGFTNGINSAILRYNGAPNAEPTTTGTPVNRLSETSLVVSTIHVASAFTFRHWN